MLAECVLRGEVPLRKMSEGSIGRVGIPTEPHSANFDKFIFHFPKLDFQFLSVCVPTLRRSGNRRNAFAYKGPRNMHVVPFGTALNLLSRFSHFRLQVYLLPVLRDASYRLPSNNSRCLKSGRMLAESRKTLKQRISKLPKRAWNEVSPVCVEGLHEVSVSDRIPWRALLRK